LTILQSGLDLLTARTA